MDPFTALANQISGTFGIGSDISVANYGYPVQQNPLGQLADIVADPSAERRYLEEGFVRMDPVNVDAQQFELMLQEPNMTVLVKKRAFSTLSENYRFDFMNAEEKLYIKATTLLFQNKCNLIQNFEKLTKIARVSSATGQLDTQLMPLIIDLVDQASSAFATLSSFGQGDSVLSNYNAAVNAAAAEGFDQLSNVVQQIRQVFAFSPPNDYTTWVADTTNVFQSTFGTGTGVIELTNIISMDTNTSVNFSDGGGCSFTIADPYKMMLITDSDIEWAISDALNFVANNAVFQLGTTSLSGIAANDIITLNAVREARGASDIEIIAGPDPISGTPTVKAIIQGNGTQINFTYSLLSSIIQPISGGGVTLDPSALQANLGFEGLNEQEAGLFSTAISDQYAALNFTALPAIIPSQPLSDPSGKSVLDINFVRRKLRFHYGNKLIIQPMDQVHVYMGSKSQMDSEVLGTMAGAFGAFGFMTQAGNTITNISNQFSTAFQTSANIDLVLEKQVFVGIDFPTDLWAMMRNTFINDKDGCHVFAGIVANSGETYNPGSYNVTISAHDNTHYFDFGTVNMNPGLDTFNGPLFDPITPFVTQFDNITTNFSNQVPQFLPENQAILNSQTFNSGLLRYRSGSNFGKPATASNFYLDKQIDKDGTVRSIYHMPDGLVYAWKQGIGTYVYNADSFNAINPSNIGQPRLTSDPFSGQDVINILSLLITGTPYNYSTYFKAIADAGGGAVRDPQSGQGPEASFYSLLGVALSKNNLLWGGFIPFKSITIDEQTAQAMMFKQTNISQANSIITTNLTQLQNLQSKLITAQATLASTPTNTTLTNAVSSIQAQMNTILSTITSQTSQIHTNLQTTLPITVAGNDVAFSPSQSTAGQTASSSAVGQELRRETNLLTRRLSWQVRANTDRNYLMIDDVFEKDPDIIAMGVKFTDKLNLFSNEYKSVREQIATPASILNLEVYADTQGHVRIRPQQYNKMPSSVFYRMMQMQQNNSIQIYPSFFQSLFVTQLNTLLTRLSVLELEMRLDGAVLGISDDLTLAGYMTSSGFGIGQFQFISDQSGNISNISAIQTNADPSAVLGQIPSSFDASIQAQGAVTSIFNAADRANLVTGVFANPLNKLSTTLASTYISSLISLIFQKSGQQITLDNFILPTQSGIVVAAPSSAVDVVAVTADLGTKASQRQQLLLSLSGALANAREVATLNANPTDTANAAAVPNLYSNANVPQVFQNMLEDETYDDLGPGSGTRYIIHDYQIVGLEINETPPEFNYVEVQGQLDPFLDNGSLPSDFNQAFPDGGNALVTAAAIDYDMWQQYGLKISGNRSVAAPFFSSAQNQCAPYAAMLLSRARKNIIQGTLTIIGNEFMQPGEVIYIESRNLLFYVESVHHNFVFGEKFQTSLKINYGHNAGEFIPTPTDIIGKLLYNNRDTASSVAYRGTTTSNEIPIGAIVLNPQSGSVSPTDAVIGGQFGTFNQQVISNMLYTAAGIFNYNQTSGANATPMVELRIFYNSKNGAASSSLSSARSIIQGLLTGAMTFPPTSVPSGLPTKIQLQSSQVVTANIDSTSTSEYRSPSQKAVDAARNVAASFPGAGGIPSDPVGSAIANYVIDCVITLSNATPSSTGSATPVGI